MTIAEAAAKVLKQAKSPMSAHETYEAIKKQGLYQFKAKDPAGVVSKTLKKNSLDATSLFIKMENNKFRLR